jgi:para-nitrobenzyl esterase
MSVASDPRLIVETTSGPYRGVRAGAVDVWRGMRYAAPPVGENRWRRARPVDAHTEVLDADRFGAVCPQQRHPVIVFGDDPVMDEDCLFLNVWAPVAPSDSPRPVMVWVHGGAYVYGSGSQPLYDGARMAADAGIVVVTINYRIGAFGFTDLSSVIDGAEPNAALSDVLAALTWVRDNIAGFGGDPAQVTLAGESAGGGIVTTMLTVPAARGLFHRAIAQSSPATTVFDTQRMVDVAHRIDRAVSGSLATASSSAVVTAGMLAFSQVPQNDPGVLAFAPVVDGDLVPRHPLDVYRAGEAMQVPLLIGSNRDESAVFRYMKSPLMPIDLSQIRKMFERIAIEQPNLPIPDERRILGVYPRHPKAAGLAIARDLAFRMPAIWVAHAHSARVPVYLYRFDWAPRMYKVLRLGATHGTELNYMWGNLPTGSRDITYKLGGRSTGEKVAERMLDRWGSFVRDGVPGHRGGTDWSAFSPDRRTSMVISSQDRPVDGLDDRIAAAWGDEVLAFR